jgi:hypothetical protein
MQFARHRLTETRQSHARTRPLIKVGAPAHDWKVARVITGAPYRSKHTR